MLSSVTSFNTTSLNGTCEILGKNVNLSISERTINASVPFEDGGSLNVSRDTVTSRNNINISAIELTSEVVNLIAALNIKFDEIVIDLE